MFELLRLLGPRLGGQPADTLNESKRAKMKDLRADTVDNVLRIALTCDVVDCSVGQSRH
jgi:hypothetical protein